MLEVTLYQETQYHSRAVGVHYFFQNIKTLKKRIRKKRASLESFSITLQSMVEQYVFSMAPLSA
jgi:hypothetical protein